MNIAYEYRNIVLANRTTLDCPGLFALLHATLGGKAHKTHIRSCVERKSSCIYDHTAIKVCVIRMKPCCCSSPMCSDVWGEMRTDHSDQTSVEMDIALLKEQYNSIRDQQRRHTQVLCFKTGQTSCLDLHSANREHTLYIYSISTIITTRGKEKSKMHE